MFSFMKKSKANECVTPSHPQTPENTASSSDDNVPPGTSASIEYDDEGYYDDDMDSTFDGDRSTTRGSTTHNKHVASGRRMVSPPPPHTNGIRSRSARLSAERQSRYHDEPEVDYDDNPTQLYTLIEGKDWDGALARLDRAPYEARTWVSRKEAADESKLRWRLLPIHATCVFRSPLSLIERLLDAYPDGSQMRDDQGMLPVHLACRNGASKGVVVTLLNSFPESMSVKDRKGRVPLTLVENSTSQNREAVILAMRKFEDEVNRKAEKEERAKLEAKAKIQNGGISGGAIEVTRAPSATNSSVVNSSNVNLRNGEMEVDYEHRTVLFRLVLKKDWDNASRRGAEHPEEASTWIVTKGFNGNLRFLPIHKACVLQPPSSAVESLVAAHPDGASSRDQDGWLPLHCACFYGASEAVVSALLVAYPKGAQSKDDDGRLPLHYSCLKSAPVDVVSALLRSFPKGAMSKDDEGRLPIHHACSKGAGSDVVEALLRASPRGAQSKDDQGRLPLHHACRKGASERVIATLLRVYPRGAQAKDDQDKLPLHYACQAGAEEGVVTNLLSAYPDSVDVKNGFGYTPLAEARAMGDNPKMEGVVKVLEGFKAEQEKKRERTASANGAEGGSSRGAGGGSKKEAELEKQVSQLNQRVKALEGVLSNVGKLGAEMKRGLAKGSSDSDDDFKAAVGKFAEQLAALKVSATPQSSRKTATSPTPSTPTTPTIKPGE